MKRKFFLIIKMFAFGLGLTAQQRALALGQPQYVETQQSPGSFTICAGTAVAAIAVETNDWPGVVRAANDLRADITRVTGRNPKVISTRRISGANVILVGTVGKSEIIDLLVRERKIDVSQIAGKWESFFIQSVSQPFPGVENALVICGSDKRGTIYGIYDLSEQIGVSPWYYWADVPPQHHEELFVKAGIFLQGPPSVKYRGIFLNDEAPDLTRWVQEKYGKVEGFGDVANYGRGFYTNLFEVILRCKGNYLWPAMWNNRFSMDDPQNAPLADMYGVVIGTSHQDPLLRNEKEWTSGTNYGRRYGNRDFYAHPDVLEAFWHEGLKMNAGYESILTLGLRGVQDSTLFPGGTDEQNMEMLGKIFAIQRRLIAEVINPDVTKPPQLWSPYKEVLAYYEKGFRPPDDVTILWTDDNWGNVRRLPTAEERKRSGGAGVYYHFDYHGGPRSYQWINTSPLPKIWDQMSLAKQYGADRIWIVNVGHFKGYELPMEFFLNLGWNTERWNAGNLAGFTKLWAEREFGNEFADDIADIVSKYTKYNGRRKPELVDQATYSLVNYNEFENVVADYNALAAKAQEISDKLPEAKRAAFYELVLFPTKASAQLNEMYLAAAKNALYAAQGRASANDFAAQTRALFSEETNLMHHFNHEFLDGKWDHFMDQPVIGYDSWRDPPQNNLDAVELREIQVPDAAALGVAAEGSDAAVTNGEISLPQFDSFNRQRHWIDVFNMGKAAFEFSAIASDPWISVSETGGSIEKDKRLWVGVDWDKAPKGGSDATIKISGANGEVTVRMNVFNPAEPSRDGVKGFVEGEGFVSIEPEHFTANNDAGENRWIKIPDYGRTLSGMRATAPLDAPAATPGKDSPSLEYKIYLFSTRTAQVVAVTSPVLNFMPDRGIRYAVSFDDEPPQTVTLVPQNYSAQNGNQDWETSVKCNARTARSSHTIAAPGWHTLKFWMIDPGVVLQKIVVNTGGLQRNYLGPPESYRSGFTSAGRQIEGPPPTSPPALREQ